MCVDDIARTLVTSCQGKRNQPAERFPEVFEDIPQASKAGAPRIARMKMGTPLGPDTIVSLAPRFA